MIMKGRWWALFGGGGGGRWETMLRRKTDSKIGSIRCPSMRKWHLHGLFTKIVLCGNLSVKWPRMPLGILFPILTSGIFTPVDSFSHLITLTHLLTYALELTDSLVLILTHTTLMPSLRGRHGTMCIAKGLVVPPGIPRSPPLFRYPLHWLN